MPTPDRRLAIDVGLTAVVLAAACVAILAAHEPGSVARNWFAYVLGACMALPVLLRRRRPTAEVYAVCAALLAYYAIGYPGFPPAVVLAVPLYDAAYAGRTARALPVPVLLLLTGTLVAVRNGFAPLDAVDVFLPQFALVAVAVLLGALVRSRQAYAAAAEERVRLRVVEERLRIARELHDTVAHALSTITVQSGTALFTQDPAKTHEALTAIRQTGKEALAEMRTTLGVLRSEGERMTPERDAGLARLPALLEAVRAAGLEVALSNTIGTPLPDPVDHAAYRILQESLTNTLRHAGPSATAAVSLREVAGCLQLEVSDDGRGPTGPPSSGGHGLTGMAERAEALGGTLTAGPAARGAGFRVVARLPFGGGG
ncbi:MAG: sensor histidine kinase [Kribbellaceae bacterium]|nr:sensor histidine kinase [Kribbellaceae bacterium]